LIFLLDTKTAFSLSIHHSSFINSDTNNKVSLSKSSKIGSINLHCIPRNYTIKFLTIYYNFLPSYTWQHRLSFNGRFKFKKSNLVDEWRKLSEFEEVEMPGWPPKSINFFFKLPNRNCESKIEFHSRILNV
jgi:hypothetical protein